MIPRLGDGNFVQNKETRGMDYHYLQSLENDSPSRGRKPQDQLMR